MKIVPAEMQHAELMLHYHLDNALRFKRWSPAPPSDFYTLEWWEERLQERERQYLARTAVHFIGLPDDESHVIGACSLTNILYDPAWYCSMGYSVDGRHEGRGDMTRIVRHAIDYAFNTMGLNRIAASYMPANERSARLLERLGFEKEGFSRRYLKINGQWADHINTALLNPAVR